MASYIDLNDLGSFASINALWAAYPEGGQEGDYCTIDGVKYRWDKYDRMWVADPNFGPTPARNVDTFYGDVNVHNNLTVAGTIRAKGINNPCVGFFPSVEALEEKWPNPKVGWWAIVGDTIPGEIYHCVTEGEWTDSGETGGSGEVDLTEYAKLTDIPEIADDLVTNSGTKVLSARQGKILNEKIPPVVDNLTSTSATSSLSAKQGKVLNEKIPAVIDNLTTSSPISALSAKQGKILKTLIDNIGSINVQGIQGFWPIDSLDDLPESPTEEQKKLAYLYENALYIYVGEGGDTLDGKYKSTQLVTLDWNDKAYAPSIYNGLGRTTLKKNMVGGVNVLTAAMISTDNTEYFIQYDYDLDGAEVTLPANAGLVFMGGSIKNGTLIGNNTRIVAKKGVMIFDNITIQGTWDVAEAYSSWFKMHKKGYKIADGSVMGNAVTKYHGSDNEYHELGTLTSKSDIYFVQNTLSNGAVKVNSVFVPFLTLEFYRGSDNEQHALSTLTSVSSVNFVKNTLGVGSNVIESSVFATATTGTFYKGTDKKYYTIDEVTLIDGVYYVTSTLVDGEVGPNSIATTAVTMYLASDEKYYEASSLQSVDSTYFVTGTLNSGNVKVDSVFAVGVYKGNNNQYYSLGRLQQVASTDFVASTLDSGTVTYGSVFTVSEVYATFRVEGYNTDSSIDYVAAPTTVPGTFDASSYEQYDDTASLQSLFDIRAKKTVVEDGIYIIKGDTRYSSNSRWNGIYVDGHNDCEIVLEGWLKVLPNNRSTYYSFDVIGCQNILLTGNGGIQGDLLEHLDVWGEGGQCLSVANTKNLTVEGLTFSYAWGDCIYCHWWTNGRESVIPRGNSLQQNHTFRNVKIIYGGRTGLVYERGDNVVVDSCYFARSGAVRGKPTYSAVDIEPFNRDDTSIRYVSNFEFKNNVFEHSASGLRLERCVNCSVHDNIFDDCWSGVNVVWHTDVTYDITGPQDKGWVKSRMAIYNNYIRRVGTGIQFGTSTYGVDNINIYANTFVSCNTVFNTGESTILKTCHIYNNTSYGCGRWNINALVDCDIHGNRNYACKMPLVSGHPEPAWIIYLRTIDSCSNSKFHDNWFSLDYNKSFYGLGEYGKEEKYHGLFVGMNWTLTYGVDLQKKGKVHFYDNHTSDDFYVNHYTRNNLSGGMNSVRTEESNVFIVNDTFKSKTYGDEGVVVSGAILSQPWLEGVRDFAEMSSGDTVQYGEIIKNGDYYYICNGSGTVGETMRGGTATFLSDDYKVQSGSAGTLKIAFITRGLCTSETRPDTFLFAGRTMWETDTNKEIVYNGTAWVYNDIYTE